MKIRHLVVAALITFTFACEDENAIKPEEAQSFVAEWAKVAENDINGRAAGAAVSDEIKAVMEVSAKSEAEKASKDRPKYAQIALDVYTEKEFKPVLIQRGKLTPVGEAVWGELKNVKNHGIDPKAYKIEELEAGLKEIETLSKNATQESFAPTAEEQASVQEWLTGKSKLEFPLDETSYEKLSDAVVADSDRLQGAIKNLEELGASVGKKSARMEAMLAIGMARLSRSVTYTSTRRVFLHNRVDDKYYEMGKTNQRPNDALGRNNADRVWRQARRAAERMQNPPEYLSRRVKEGMLATFEAEKPADEIKKHLRARHPQYEKLMGAYKSYSAIVDGGGWEEVEKTKGLKKGSKSDAVKALKTRLQKEGYLKKDATIDNNYDDALVEAVKSYQETHQMEVTGKPEKVFWKSLNASAKKRLKQIAVNLDRLRQTQIRKDDDNYFVYINVPDFHAEVWEEKERKMRFRVVVGNNNRVQDEETKEWTRANRTPVPLAAMIDRVIYNPYWVVTPRVRTNEILRDVRKDLTAKYEAAKAKAVAEGKDPSTIEMAYLNKETGEFDVSLSDPANIPSWYAAHGYEVVGAGRSYEYVRQKPGPGNALGQVKVIFPNLHDVYLHDTNARALFKNPVRAYSHGCMRMQNPLDFAEYLLRRDKLFESNKVPEILKKRTANQAIYLNEKVPVFIEYYTTRVDDDGRVHFLADPYDYDDKPLEALLTSGKN